MVLALAGVEPETKKREKQKKKKNGEIYKPQDKIDRNWIEI